MQHCRSGHFFFSNRKFLVLSHIVVDLKRDWDENLSHTNAQNGKIVQKNCTITMNCIVMVQFFVILENCYPIKCSETDWMIPERALGNAVTLANDPLEI